jgi:hypothetical protein
MLGLPFGVGIETVGIGPTIDGPFDADLHREQLPAGDPMTIQSSRALFDATLQSQ